MSARRHFLVMALVLWVAVIFLSATSAANICDRIFSSLFRSLSPDLHLRLHFIAEKSVHVVLFAGLGALLWKLIPQIRLKTVVVLSVGACIGVLSEFVESFFPHRDPTLRDVIIDITATALGILCSLKFRLKHRANSRPASDSEPLEVQSL